MSAFQQNLYELERKHQKLKQQYEDEIIRLRRELEAVQRRGADGTAAPAAGPKPVPASPVQPPKIGHGSSDLFGGILGGAANGGPEGMVGLSAPGAPAAAGHPVTAIENYQVPSGPGPYAVGLAQGGVDPRKRLRPEEAPGSDGTV